MVYIIILPGTCMFSDEAKRFEDGLQEHKDFLLIQRKYVSTQLVG